ncbi:hypothetical protein CHLRE_06g298880v5 [Chlamydomonas reinhardtii]|uniref:Uncharacterized protein n=1 Tax=Chlamydomonas reinhardtii TaxID=3055 RepID=A0A2K3DQT5_CHLRE|nr:uncharacterized protein CHLRE_06g298880v5 [Chlamydomonas reinhardtii]PNW82903.1 hypothetical protein CHLRE_06g298880v5 [Chlamydomonas reinhardtii]
MNATQGQRKATPKPTPSPPQISTTSQQILLYADPNVVGDVPNGLAATFAPLQRQVWSMASMFGGVAVTSLANGLTDKSFQDALVDVDWAPVLVIPPRRGSGLTGYENMTHIQRYLKAGGIVVVVGTFRTVSPFDPDGLDARELASLFIQAQSDSTGTWPAGFASYCNLGKQQDTAAYMYQHCCSPTSILVEESADAQYVAGQTIRSANWPRDTSSLPNMVPGSSWPLRGCDTASTGGQSVYMYDWTSETYGYSKSASAVHAWSVGSAGGKLFYLAYDWSAGENTAWGQVLLAIARMVYRRFGEVPPAPAPLRPPSPAPPPDNCNGDPLLPPGVLAPGGQTVSFMRYAEPSVRYDDVCSGRRFRLVCRAGRFYDATTNKLIDSESVLDLFPAENCYQRCNPAAPEVADLGLTADDDYDVGQSVSYTRYAAAEVAYDGTCQAETLLRTCQLPQAGSAGVTAMVWSAPIGKPGFTFKTCLKQPNPAGRH